MQAEDSHNAVPAAPILVLLPDSNASLRAAAPVDGDEPRVLGLGLMRRTVMAASRAGYGRIYFLAREQSAPPGVATVPNWSSLAPAFASHQLAPLIIAPAAIVGESEWLEQLVAAQIEPATWAAIPHRVVMLAASAVPDALAALSAEEGAYDLTAVQDRLTGHLGSPAQIPAAIDPLVVVTSADIDVAERRLLRSLVKDTDGFMARHVERPISLQISRHLAPTARNAKSNHHSLGCHRLMPARPSFYPHSGPAQTVGALLFLHIRSWMDATENWPG